jgi:Uma2 family endonuclease
MEQLAPPPSSGPRRYTPAEYRRICDSTDQLLDYWEGIITDRTGKPIQFSLSGEVLDMAGATPDHGRIGANISGELRQRCKGGPCEVLDSSVAVKLGQRRKNAHPDVTVCCEEVRLDETSDAGPVILNPKLVFEVLSPSTQNYDMTRKADGYREIESLQEYVFVWQDEPRVETFYRSAEGVWLIGGAVTDLAASVRLRSVGLELPLAEVYARVKFPATESVVVAS